MKFYYKLFPFIWTFTLIVIPIINSSFLRFLFPENWSYFKDYWNLFALLGMVFIIIGIGFAKKAKQKYKVKPLDDSDANLATSGIFRIIRHPIYSAWVIVFFGIALISDSIISLILCPIILVILEFHALIEERLILIPKFGNSYEKFKKISLNRIIPTPLNILLIIIVIIIIYVGFLNIS